MYTPSVHKRLRPTSPHHAIVLFLTTILENCISGGHADAPCAHIQLVYDDLSWSNQPDGQFEAASEK